MRAWRRWDLNPRPSACRADALPLSYDPKVPGVPRPSGQTWTQHLGGAPAWRRVVEPRGIEPLCAGMQSQCPHQMGQDPGVADGSRTHLFGVTSRTLPATGTATVGPAGIEPARAGVETQCLVQLATNRKIGRSLTSRLSQESDLPDAPTLARKDSNLHLYALTVRYPAVG